MTTRRKYWLHISSTDQATSQVNTAVSRQTARNFGLGLDGVRGIAILLVVAEHYGTSTAHGTSWFRYGGIAGVTLFFVLSGYLISRLLLAENTRRAKIDYRAFYMRRALRLLPALLAFLLLTPLIYWAVGD